MNKFQKILTAFIMSIVLTSIILVFIFIYSSLKLRREKLLNEKKK